MPSPGHLTQRLSSLYPGQLWLQVSVIMHLVVHTETKSSGSVSSHTKITHFSEGVAVVLGKTKETGTGGATESESEIENATEKILLVGKECLEDTDNVPGAGRETRNAPGNGKGTEITETDTANLVSF